MPPEQYNVTRSDGTPVNEGDELKVDNNLPVTYLGIGCPPYVDDETEDYVTGTVRVRYSWGAVEEVAESRAGVLVDEV